MNLGNDQQNECTAGPVTLKYEMNGHEIILVLKPGKGGLCTVAIGHDCPDGTSAALTVNGILAERIADLGQRNMFDTVVRSGDTGEIFLSRENNNEYVIRFTLVR